MGACLLQFFSEPSKEHANSQCRQGVTPFAHVDLKRASLASDLVYDVILDIVAPASPRNIELGQSPRLLANDNLAHPSLPYQGISWSI